MMIVDDPDFLANPDKQLRAAQELATLRTRILDLETEHLSRRHQRRALIERLTEIELEAQRGEGRHSRTAAMQSARASQDVRNFDESLRTLSEKIRRLAIDAERLRLSVDIAIAARSPAEAGRY
jgi:hypothetical protein